MVQYINIAASLVTVLGIFSVIYLLIKWLNRPRFIIGVLPDKKEMKRKTMEDVGSRSLFDEIHFDSKILAHEIKNESELPSLANETDSEREVIAKSGTIALPIIIQNIGRTEADRYEFVVFFTSPEIKIVDLCTETLLIDGLYVQEIEALEDKLLIEKVPKQKIRDMYKELNLESDYLSCYGTLQSHTFEMINLTIRIPQDCNDFYIIFRIDSKETFLKRAIFSQHIKVIRK